MKVVETRKMDSLGRVVLPAELRKEFDIDEKSSIDICVNDNQIILRKSEPSCKICRVAGDLKEVKGKNVFVCGECREEICKL